MRVRRLVQGRHIGIHRSPYHGSAAEFAEYRPYLPGDNIRDIDWRVFARTDRFFVKRHEEETNLTARIVLDASGSMNFEKKWPAATLLAGTVSYVLSMQGDAISVTIAGGNSPSVEPRRGRMHLHDVMDVLDSATPSGEGSVVGALERSFPMMRRPGLVVLISDFLSEDAEPLRLGLRRIRKQGHDAFVLHVVSKSELNLTSIGPTLYVDPETGVQIETVPEEVRSVYRRNLDRHLNMVAGTCRALDFDHLLVVAEEGPGTKLGRFLAGRSHRARMN